MASKKGKKQKGKQTKLGMQHKKDGAFSDWYSEVIIKSEMIEYYDVSGCYILRPWSYQIWEGIQGWFDTEIKKLGVKNSYFPLFVKKDALEREKDHVEGFSAEVAWVTKSGSSELQEPIAIRPTSETIMYPAFAKWIQSHRDLPLRLNQWTSVVRWEFKHPTPFLRTREFLWQEGHSAFGSAAEADVEVFDILDLYARVYEELMAVPVIKGRKSEGEKFAGGRFTTTVEGFIPAAGRAIQGATSHSLGQNFAKMFEILYQSDAGNVKPGEAVAEAKESPEETEYLRELLAKKEAGPLSDHETKMLKALQGGKRLAWQNSWGLTTRTIGVMVMVHGDDKGLVLPPRLAPIQVVIVWIYKAKDDAETVAAIKARCAAIADTLAAAGVRVKLDDRDDKTSAWKYGYWELRGVPLRLEVGPRDLKQGTCLCVRRHNFSKTSIPIDDIATAVPAVLTEVQAAMLAKARKERDEHITVAMDWAGFTAALNDGNMILAPWCGLMDSEEDVKERTKDCRTEEEKAAEAAAKKKAKEEGKLAEYNANASKRLTGAAKTLCIPFNQPPLPEGTLCFSGNGKPATAWCLWGRSY